MVIISLGPVVIEKIPCADAFRSSSILKSQPVLVPGHSNTVSE